MIDSGKVKINDSAVGKTWAKLKSKVKGIVVPNDKSATKPKVPDILDTSVSMQFQYGILSESQLFSVWNNLDVVSEDNSDVVAKGVYDEVLNNGFCMVGKKRNLDTGAISICILYPEKDMNNEKNSTYNSCYLQYDGNNFQMCSKVNGTVYKIGRASCRERV